MTSVGEIWAYRDKARTPGTPVHAVEVLQHGPPRTPKRVRIRWVDGEYAGLDEWVNSSRLICRWDDVGQLLDQEELHLALAEAVKDYDRLQVEAADFVLDGVPGVAVMGYNRGTEGTFIVWDVEHLPLMTEAELLAAPHAFVDSGGTYHGPWTVGVEVARRICAHGPHAVLAAVDEEEKDLREVVVTGHLRFGEAWRKIDTADAEKRLADRNVVLGLVRSWCGSHAVSEWDREAALRAEVERLQALAEEMIRWLKDAGHPVKAGEFRRRLWPS